jgi:hypothetical protein
MAWKVFRLCNKIKTLKGGRAHVAPGTDNAGSVVPMKKLTVCQRLCIPLRLRRMCRLVTMTSLGILTSDQSQNIPG